MSETMDKTKTGLYGKFVVTRTDGQSEPGQKHEGCRYFVLDYDHDKHAHPALLAYAQSCEAEYPMLARDVRMIAKLMTIGPSTYFGIDRPAIVSGETDGNHATTEVSAAAVGAQRQDHTNKLASLDPLGDVETQKLEVLREFGDVARFCHPGSRESRNARFWSALDRLILAAEARGR